jgi:sulfofructose kinase
MKTPYDLISLGRATIDILNLVDHFPTGEEIIRVKDSSLQGGGPVATAAAAAARLGLATAIIDCIGDDWRGQMILEEFRQIGVSTDLLQIAAGHTSTQSVILVEAGSGRRAIINARGSAPEPRLIPTAVHALQQCRVLHLASSYPVPSQETIQYVKGHGRVCFDGGSGLYRESDRELIPLVDWCITSRSYAEQFSGETEPEKILKAMKACGPEVVGFTNGEEGCWFLDEDGILVHQPAFTVDQVVDTTGCGDAFHGGFIYGMLTTGSSRRAFEIANAVGSLTATCLGGRRGLPDLTTVQQFLKTANY